MGGSRELTRASCWGRVRQAGRRFGIYGSADWLFVLWYRAVLWTVANYDLGHAFWEGGAMSDHRALPLLLTPMPRRRFLQAFGVAGSAAMLGTLGLPTGARAAKREI